MVSLAIFAVALAPRLAYLFFGGDPQNAGDSMTDTYHHWQIGYLTMTVGLSHGFRLWDLKGVEYFWGLLHPALLIVAFTLTRSTDIVVTRLVSILFGSLTVALLFQLCRRFWDLRVAAVVTAFAAFAPPLIFTDALGMVEPVAIALVLLGIACWPARGFLAGVLWGFAAMARSEAWLETFGLLIAAGLRRVSFERWLPLALGWGLTMAVYAKFLLDHTGNPIYPVYWEYLVEVTGRWLGPVTSSQAHAVQPLFVALLALSTLGLAGTLWKRPESSLLLTYGFGSTAFVMALLAFTPFLSSWSGWVWRMRLFAFSLDFGFILAAVFLFVVVPRFGWRLPQPTAWALLAAGFAALQLTWLPIQAAVGATEAVWQADLASGTLIGEIFQQPGNRWGRLNIPADQPTLTYTLVRYGGLQGGQFTSQLYDPFYDLPAGYRYQDHRTSAGRLMSCWLKNTNTSLFVVPQSNQNYTAYIDDHPGWFVPAGDIAARGWVIESVSRDQIAAACN